MSELGDWIRQCASAREASTGPSRGLPRNAYLDPTLLDREVRAWLGHTWLLVGLAQDLPEPGSLFPVPYLRLFLARDRAGSIRAFHNICRHRGHRLVTEAKQGAAVIVCPYHGWCYDLDGDLKSTSQFAGTAGGFAPDFDPVEFGLRAIRCESWHDWIFVNLDGQAPPLSEHLAPLLQRLWDVDLAGLVPFHNLEHGEVKANWKLVMENSLEPYHTPYVHKQTGAGIPLEEHHMVVEDGLLGCAIKKPDMADDQVAISDGAITAESHFLVVPPLFVFVLYAGRIVIVHRNIPSLEDPERTWRSVHLYSLAGQMPSPAEIEDWIEVERIIHIDEDGPVYETLQDGKHSPASDDGGLLSPVWESSIAAFYDRWFRALERKL